MYHGLSRFLSAGLLSVCLCSCLGGEEESSRRVVTRILGDNASEGVSREVLLYRADGSVCRSAWSDADYRETEFSNHGKVSHTYYFGEPENSTYLFWNWVTSDSVTQLLHYKGQPVEGAVTLARRYFRNAHGGTDSIRIYDRLGHHDETYVLATAADSSWDVEHRRDPFDGATLSLYHRYFRNPRGEIDSAYHYSRWYGGIFTSGDTTFNADTTRLVYQYTGLNEAQGGAECLAPD